MPRFPFGLADAVGHVQESQEAQGHCFGPLDAGAIAVKALDTAEGMRQEMLLDELEHETGTSDGGFHVSNENWNAALLRMLRKQQQGPGAGAAKLAAAEALTVRMRPLAAGRRLAGAPRAPRRAPVGAESRPPG